MKNSSCCWAPRCVAVDAPEALCEPPPQALTPALVPQSNPRQSFWQWMAKHERSYANDVQVCIYFMQLCPARCGC